MTLEPIGGEFEVPVKDQYGNVTNVKVKQGDELFVETSNETVTTSESIYEYIDYGDPRIQYERLNMSGGDGFPKFWETTLIDNMKIEIELYADGEDHEQTDVEVDIFNKDGRLVESNLSTWYDSYNDKDRASETFTWDSKTLGPDQISLEFHEWFRSSSVRLRVSGEVEREVERVSNLKVQ